MPSRRTTRLMLATIAVASMATSCGDDDEPSAATDDETTATPTVAETASDATTATTDAVTATTPTASTEAVTTTTEAATTTTEAVPTTTEAVPTTTEAITTDVLAAGLLTPDEMESIFGSIGQQNERGPDELLLVNACSSAESFYSVEPQSSRLGDYRADAGGFYSAYVGYYPDGQAEGIYEDAQVSDGCDDFVGLIPASGNDPFPVSPGIAVAEIPADAPRNTMVQAFTDNSGTTPTALHVAYVQQGDYLLVLTHVTNEDLSEVDMTNYVGAAIARFTNFVSQQ